MNGTVCIPNKKIKSTIQRTATQVIYFERGDLYYFERYRFMLIGLDLTRFAFEIMNGFSFTQNQWTI